MGRLRTSAGSRHVLLVLALLAALSGTMSGCFSAKDKAGAPEPSVVGKVALDTPTPGAPTPPPTAERETSAALSAAGGAPGSPDEAQIPPTAAVDRKLIRTASITLEVESTEAALKSLEAMATGFGGFLGNTSIARHADGSQSGTVTLRVPVGKFAEAVEKAKALGKVERVDTEVQDVTNEYVDLDARLRNAKREETEILKLFERGGKLSDIIQIESKLAQVRGQIEQMQGQLRVMNEQISLCTLTLTVHEKGEAAVAALDRYDVRYHLRSAWRSLLGLLQGLLTFAIYLVVVGWVFWVPVVLLVWVIRRRRAAAARRAGAPPTA